MRPRFPTAGSKRAAKRLLGSVLVVVLLIAGATSLDRDLRWRAVVLVDKMCGKLPDIGWSDLAWMLRPGSGLYVAGLAQTPNPFEVIENPRTSPADIEAGKRLFARHCSACHGDDARGGPGGPSLRDRNFRQGRSAWALYRTITRGVPGTAMSGHVLARNDVWRIIAYLDDMLLGRAARGDDAPAAHVAPLSPEELSAAASEPAQWLTYSGTYDGHRHSGLSRIDRESIARLRVEWERQLPDAPVDASAETSPIVRGSTMLITEPGTGVMALDAASGRVLWKFTRELPGKLSACCGPNNRGVAILGSLVFVGTLDGHLLALDAESGRLVWDVEVARAAQGYSITGAPLAIGSLVVTGVAGGEYDTRGFIDAYDAASGKHRWRFYTIPAAGESGSKSWDGTALRNGAAPTWVTGAYDPRLGVIYWGVGNPHPNFYGARRRGDNLYSDSVVALDAQTGKLRWYFQFTPHDLHDWDSAQTPILVDATVEGAERELIAWPNRNGFYYLLDRTNGKFLLGVPFVRETWADGLDASGRPRVRADSIPTRSGALVYPSVTGGTNWWASSYDPGRGLIYVPTIERGSFFFASPDREVDVEGETLGGDTEMVPHEHLITSVEALDVASGKLRWRHDNPPRLDHGQTGGVLSTAGGLVFGSDLETFFALDADTGAELWHFDAGAQILAAPISYELDGRQYVAIAAGRAILALALAPEVTDVAATEPRRRRTVQ